MELFSCDHSLLSSWLGWVTYGSSRFNPCWAAKNSLILPSYYSYVQSCRIPMAFNYHTITSISVTFCRFRHRRLPPASVATSLHGSSLPTPSCCCPWPRCLPLLPPPLLPPADPGPARYPHPRPKWGSDAVVRDCEWMIPLLTSADASIAAMATKGTMSCSLASDYSICTRSLQEKDELWWELLPLNHWEGPNLSISTIALRALSDDGAEEEGGFMLRSAAL